MNISKETIETLKEMGYTFFFTINGIKETGPNEANEMDFAFLRNGDEIEYINVTIKETKKETTLDYIMNRINAKSVYRNFSDEFNKVIKQFGLAAYPTSYGIGVSVLFAGKQKLNEVKSKIENALSQTGIAYTTEYSEARWVFRYRISKSAANIAIISGFKG